MDSRRYDDSALRNCRHMRAWDGRCRLKEAWRVCWLWLASLHTRTTRTLAILIKKHIGCSSSVIPCTLTNPCSTSCSATRLRFCWCCSASTGVAECTSGVPASVILESLPGLVGAVVGTIPPKTAALSSIAINLCFPPLKSPSGLSWRTSCTTPSMGPMGY